VSLHPHLLNELPAHDRLVLLETFSQPSFITVITKHVVVCEKQLIHLNTAEANFQLRFTEIQLQLKFWQALQSWVSEQKKRESGQ
jgi:hypothetical protein